jgi:hypothetical protein
MFENTKTEKAMSFSLSKPTNVPEKKPSTTFAPVTAETLDRTKDSQTLIDLNLPRSFSLCSSSFCFYGYETQTQMRTKSVVISFSFSF